VAPKPNGRRYTDAQRAEWLRLHRAGQAPIAIGKACGVSPETVRTHLKKAGLAIPAAAKATGASQTCTHCRHAKPTADFWVHPQTRKPTRMCLACHRQNSAAGGRRRQAKWRASQAAHGTDLTRTTAKGRDLHARMARLRALAQAAREKRKRQVADGGAGRAAPWRARLG
jgi:hypothetical protein